MNMDRAQSEVLKYCFIVFDTECSRLEHAHKLNSIRWRRFRTRKALVQRITEWAIQIAEGIKPSEEIFREIREEFGVDPPLQKVKVP